MAINPIKTPFTNMSFTPDVPSSSLGPNEYNLGQNVETDTRSIKSVLGDQYILDTIPGNIIFIEGGFRENDIWWYIVATSQGKWYAINDAGYTDITPIGIGNFTGYNTSTVITGSWNGNVLFLNDMTNPPMYLLPNTNVLYLYDNAPDNYIWNYYSDWSALTAGFLRVYNSPNLGSLLVAGNLTANVISTGTTQNFPTTLRWSQNFGLNSGPTTWAPTIANTANEVEMPVRGPLIDGFPLNGNFYICSYWDTCVMSPIAYQSSSAPVFGIKLLNQGRGMLNENCWAIVDNTAYGLDARDIWSFDGGSFKPIGDQRLKNYFYANLNPSYTNQVYIKHNSSKYSIEIYYPDLNSTGMCNQMLSYRYDLDIWNAPRTVDHATQAVESPRWTGSSFNLGSRGMVYASGIGNVALVQKDIGTSFVNDQPISTLFQRNNISYGQPYSASVQVHRVLPEIYGTGNIQITLGGANSVGSDPVFKPTETLDIVTENPWIQVDQNEYRVNTLKVESNSSVNSWQMTAANWQITVVQETR